MSTRYLITVVPQADGGQRELYARTRTARDAARATVDRDRAMVDHIPVAEIVDVDRLGDRRRYVLDRDEALNCVTGLAEAPRGGQSRVGRPARERSTTFDFGDGLGPVPAARHTNPDGSIGGWVADTALVYGNALVCGDAWVCGNARVSGDARASRTPLTITGGEYPVTICDAPYVCVGCQCLTLDEWAAGAAPEKCPRLETMRAGLLLLAAAHHGVSK